MDITENFCKELNTQVKYTSEEMCTAFYKGKNERTIYSPFGNKFEGGEKELIKEWKEFTCLFHSL